MMAVDDLDSEASAEEQLQFTEQTIARQAVVQ
jgi:hypothetical protein